MKSILVALSESPGGLAAQDLALSLATKHHAKLTAVSILDIGYLTAPEPTPIGGTYYKLMADAERVQRASALNVRMGRHFREKCDAQGITAEFISLEGAPDETLRSACAKHDVILLGRDSDFHGEPPHKLARTVDHLLGANPRPLIVSPEKSVEPESVLVAYDGSVPSARALQLFVLLFRTVVSEIRLVSICPEVKRAERLVDDASAYLAMYGLGARRTPIGSDAHPSELICAEAQASGAGLVVMGAYGHRGWRAALLGSTTSRLLSSSPAALFIHH